MMTSTVAWMLLTLVVAASSQGLRQEEDEIQKAEQLRLLTVEGRDMVDTQPCGGPALENFASITLDGANEDFAVLASPGYSDGEDYPGNSYCGWKITTSSKYQLLLQCPEMQLEKGDRVTVTDGGFRRYGLKRNSDGHWHRFIGSDATVSLRSKENSLGGKGFNCFIASTARPIPCVCGVENIYEGRMAQRGEEAAPAQYPWMVVIGKPGGFRCTGALIHPEWVVTAASCKRKRTATVGLFDRTSPIFPTDEIRIVDFIVHPGYNPLTGNDDIALLRIEPIVWDDFLGKVVLPICLAKDLEYSYDNDEALIVGWGTAFSEHGEDGENRPITETVTVMSNDQAMAMFPTGSITENKFATLAATEASDKGGPLISMGGANHELVGVRSHYAGSPTRNPPDVYTRVAKYVPWIRAFVDDCGFCGRS